jgi:hypothetical protein
MCRGGRFLASFCAGTEERPDVPDLIGDSLTLTVERQWVVWAHKLARPDGARFMPLTGGHGYPKDATAVCRLGRRHAVPDRSCTCGFHAVSGERGLAPLAPFGFGCLRLDVVLSGRILAFEWPAGGVLFRAERQTVIHAVVDDPEVEVTATGRRWAVVSGRRPDDPAGDLAGRIPTDPRGAGPVRLRLPGQPPVAVSVADHVGWCVAEPNDAEHDQKTAGDIPVLVSSR